MTRNRGEAPGQSRVEFRIDCPPINYWARRAIQSEAGFHHILITGCPAECLSPLRGFSVILLLAGFFVRN